MFRYSSKTYTDGYIHKITANFEEMLSMDTSVEMSTIRDVQQRIRKQLSEKREHGLSLCVGLNENETSVLVEFKLRGDLWIASWKEKYGQYLHAMLGSSGISCDIVANNERQTTTTPITANMYLFFNDYLAATMDAILLMESLLHKYY